MEETKLDKSVDKLFRFVEKRSTGFINAEKISKPYFGIFLAIFYIVYTIVVANDIYYKGWNFKLPDGKINMGLILSIIMILFVYPIQIYFFNRNLFKDFDLKLIKISSKFFVEKVVNDCFKPIIADWREEYNIAIGQSKWHAFLINFRYTFAFISAMIQQSSLQRIFEFMRIFTK